MGGEVVKKALIMVGLLFVCLLAVGCSSNTNNSDKSSKETIKWWIPNWDEDVARELVAQFEEENPDINVELSILTWDTMDNKIRVALMNNDAPDVITELESRIQNYASEGLLTELDSYYEKDLDKSDFITSALDINTYDGKLYGVPFRHDGAGILYNKGMFEEVGLNPEKFPVTFDEFLSAAEKLTIDTDGDGTIDQYGTALPLGNQDNAMVRYLQLLYDLDGKLLNEDHTKSELDSPEAIKAMKALTDQVKNGLAPKSTMEADNTRLRDLFVNEKIAMYIGGQFDIEPIQNENSSIDLGTALLPGFNGLGTTTVDGFSLLLPESGKNKEDAWKLIKFIAKPDNMAKLTETFPGTKSALEDPKFSDELLQPFADQLDKGVPKPSFKEFPEVTKIVYHYMQLIILEDMDIEKAMDNINKEIEDILD